MSGTLGRSTAATVALRWVLALAAAIPGATMVGPAAFATARPA